MVAMAINMAATAVFVKVGDNQSVAQLF